VAGVFSRLLDRIPPELFLAFERGVRGRGETIFRAQNVRLERRGPDQVTAFVRGSQLYEVRVGRTPEGGVALRCDCAYAATELEPCEHLWAVVLAGALYVDYRTWLPPLPEHERNARRVRPPRVALAPAEETGPGPHELGDVGQPGEGEIGPARARSAGRSESKLDASGRAGGWRGRPERDARPGRGPQGPPSRRPAPPALDWSELLAGVARIQSRPRPPLAWPEQREVRFALDVDSTIERGRVPLAVLVRDPATESTPRPLAPLVLRLSDLDEVPDRAVRSLLFRLNGQRAIDSSWDVAGTVPRHQSFELSCAAASELLPELCAAGLALVSASRGRSSALLVWSPAPWRFALRVERPADGHESYLLTGILRREESELPLSEPWLLTEGGFVAGDGWAAPLDDGGSFEWIGLLRRQGALEIPAADAERFLEALFALRRPAPVELPPELALAETTEAPKPALRVEVQKVPSWYSQRPPLALLPRFVYAGLTIDAQDPRERLIDLPGRRIALRDRKAEEAAVERLFALGARLPPKTRDGLPGLELSPKALPELTRVLLAEGWEVEADGKALRRATGSRLRSGGSGIDWFELEGEIDFGGVAAPLAEIVGALARGEASVRLGDGSYGVLPEEWLARHRLWLELGEARAGALRFASAQASIVAAFLAEEREAETDAGLARLGERLRRGAAVAPADPSPRFRGTLRDYQRLGLGWLRFLGASGLGGCLADEMGLGKTVQLLAFLTGRRRPRGTAGCLVVAPRSLLFNWREEAARFAPRLALREHHGAARAQSPDELAGAGVVLTTYDLLRRDVELLAGVDWDVVILDEAQAIKNDASVTAQAAKRLRARLRLAATGTPVENHLGELWSLFEFLNPGLLGRSKLLRRAGRAGFDLAPDLRGKLARALRPFLLRRTKSEVAPELPARTEQTLVCELAPAQRRLYTELRDRYRASLRARISRHGLAKSRMQVLEALLRLRQAACHPALVRPGESWDGCAKFELLVPRLVELAEEGHKTLVFSQFTSYLALLRAKLDALRLPYAYLDGATADRKGRVERFERDPECAAFLISLKAGGLGLNLTAAEYVFLLDPWWNPAVEAQAIDRTHRIGQTRPVFAYRLIAEDTVEERILALQAKKRALADAILGAEAGPLSALAVEDLELLLG
jgi:superfamily II DNA or RNA helicase